MKKKKMMKTKAKRFATVLRPILDAEIFRWEY